MLFESFKLGKLSLQNRICLPPMVVWAATEDGFVTDYIRNHYSSIRGVGLAIVEATAISPEGRLAKRQVGLWSDEHIPGLRSIAQAIASNGAVPGIQIHHAGRATNLENTFGLPLVAPSAVTTGKDMPRALAVEEIKELINKYAAAAERAVEAGFSVIEIHGAHGYLISQFLSPLANLRMDHYGGSIEDRARFALEVLTAVKRAVKGRALVSMRLGVADSSPDGLSLGDGVKVARWLETAGIDLLHISSGIGGPPAYMPHTEFSPLLQLAAKVKEYVNIPVIGVGGIRTPEQAEHALNKNVADIIAVGKAILADPLWAEKARVGSNDISLCRGCKPCGHFKHPYNCPART